MATEHVGVRFRKCIFKIPLGRIVAFAASICLHPRSLPACAEPSRASARRGEAYVVMMYTRKGTPVMHGLITSNNCTNQPIYEEHLMSEWLISQPVNQPTNRSLNQSIDQLAIQSLSPLANLSTNQINQSLMGQSISQCNRPINQPKPTDLPKPTNQAPNHPTNKPPNQSTSQYPGKGVSIYQILLGWKTYKYYYETDELPNPRPPNPRKN